MVVDTWSQKAIKEQDNQAKLGKQLSGNLLLVAMSPTNLQRKDDKTVNNYGLKPVGTKKGRTVADSTL